MSKPRKRIPVITDAVGTNGAKATSTVVYDRDEPADLLTTVIKVLEQREKDATQRSS